jgi:2-polyprenyl-6-methoxyphenol hydroxylase-like FAD-dependent oxidoreductase
MTETADPRTLAHDTQRRAQHHGIVAERGKRSQRPQAVQPALARLAEHAVVLGASMAGLLAARVLADAFDRVTVVERDPLPAAGEDRRGVPQGRHAHGLLSSGVRVFDEMFPGLLDDFAADGVPVLRESPEIYLAPGGHVLRQGNYTNPTPIYQPSRPYLEDHIRTRLRALPNVEIVDRCAAVGVVGTASRDRVTGVRVVRRGEGDEDILTADLVVDATGRGGRSTTWLAEMGYEQPTEDRIAVDIMYVSQHLRLAPGAMGRTKVVIIGAEPGRPTGVNFLEQEGDRWVLTMIGYRGHHPPTDRAGFLGFAESVVPPDVFAAIRAAQPLDDLVAHRFPASVRRRYERLARFPAGMLVFGDAICSFNPVYGQGMSVAALQAVALRDSLAGGTDHLARRFFRAASKRIEVAWQMAVGGDLSLPEVEGPRPLPVRIVNAYLGRLLRAAERDSKLTHQFVMVGSLLASPGTLLTPAVIGRVLAGNLRAGRSRRRNDGGAHGANAGSGPGLVPEKEKGGAR